jgi:hypothetical protein
MSVYVRMYACKYVCMRVCMYVCVYVILRTCARTRVCVCMYVCVYLCITYVCTYVCVCMHVRMYVCITHVCRYVSVCMYARMCVCTMYLCIVSLDYVVLAAAPIYSCVNTFSKREAQTKQLCRRRKILRSVSQIMTVFVMSRQTVRQAVEQIINHLQLQIIRHFIGNGLQRCCCSWAELTEASRKHLPYQTQHYDDSMQ